MEHSMLLCVLLLGAGVAFITAEEYNFNSYKYCQRGDEFDKSLSSGERATVIFREKTQSDILNLVPDECSMEFKAPLLGNNRLQVRFDSINRYINDTRGAKITFYDSDEIKLSKKLGEYSRAKPIKRQEVLVTKGRYLTIVVSRDVQRSKNFNVEMTIVPVSGSGTNAIWSLPLMSLSALVVVMSGVANF